MELIGNASQQALGIPTRQDLECALGNLLSLPSSGQCLYYEYNWCTTLSLLNKKNQDWNCCAVKVKLVERAAVREIPQYSQKVAEDDLPLISTINRWAESAFPLSPLICSIFSRIFSSILGTLVNEIPSLPLIPVLRSHRWEPLIHG